MRSSFKALLLGLLSQPAFFVISTAIPESVNVTVIGAGLSDLTAARDLLQAGRSVVVLEARDCVSGKVYSKPLANGGVTEVAAGFVGPTQNKVLDIISDSKLETFHTYDKGQSMLWRNDTRHLFSPNPALGGTPPVDPSSLVHITTARAQLGAWAAEVKTSAPWTHPQVTKWHSQTFGDSIDQYANHTDTKFVLATACKAVFASEPDELSLFSVLR